MRFTSIRTIAIAILLSATAWSQGVINIDTGVKGSRWPAFGVDSGTANAYAVTTVAILGPSLRTGSQIMFFAANANTSASTLAVDGGSPIAMKKNVSSALVAGDIPLNGLVIALYDGTNFQVAGFQQVSCSQLPALTGDVTSSGCTTTLVNIPDGATMAGKIVASAIAAPGTPASGKDNLFVDSTDKRFHDKNDAGTVGTTAVPKTAATHKAFNSMSAAGVFGEIQFDFFDLTGSAACGQLPALIGDVTSSAGSCTTALANIPDGATMAGSILATNIAAPSTPASGKTKIFVDLTDKRFHDKNDAGTIGTTAVAKTAATHKFFCAMSAAGVFTDCQPDYSDLTGSPTGGYTLKVNGSTLTSGDNVDLNDTTPGPGANGLNIKFQKSTAGSTDSVSGYLPGDGNATHCFLGDGTFSACPGGATVYGTCALAFGANNGPVLADADLSPQVSNRCYLPTGATIVEVMVTADAGTPSIIIAKNHLGSQTDLLSSAQPTASAGGRACANAGATVSLDGSTTCSSRLTVTSASAGDYLEPHGGTAGGTAAAFSATIVWTQTATTIHTCMMSFGANNAAAALTNGDLSPQIAQRCYLPAGSTVLEIMVTADASTPSLQIAKNHLGSQTNLLSGALATASSGGRACANAGGTTSIDGSTTCGATLTTSSLSIGDFLEPNGGTAGGTAKALSAAITYTTP